LSEDLPSAEPKKNNNRTILIVVVGVILLCCFCLAALLIFQYWLQNSDFTLVNLLNAVAQT